MTVKLYADGAVLDDMMHAYKEEQVTGFTTNPTLMKKAGISNYTKFAEKVVETFPGVPISFEVFADNFADMEREALTLASYGEAVYVKIPIMLTDGTLTLPVIERLSDAGVNLNVTALMTVEQVEQVTARLSTKGDHIVSVFAGRLADIGVDPVDIMTKSVAVIKDRDNIELLWASTREVYNIYEAEKIGVDIITVPPMILQKYRAGQAKTADQLSLDTVKTFAKDIADLQLTII